MRIVALFLLFFLPLAGCTGSDHAAGVAIPGFTAEYASDHSVLTLQLLELQTIMGAGGTERDTWPLRAFLQTNGAATLDVIYYLDAAFSLVAYELPCGYAPWRCYERIIDYAYEGFQYPWGVGLGVAAAQGQVPLGPLGHHQPVTAAAGPTFTIPETANDSTDPAFRRAGQWSFSNGRLFPDAIWMGETKLVLVKSSHEPELGFLMDPSTRDDVTTYARDKPWTPPTMSEPLWLDVSPDEALAHLREEVALADELATRGCIYTATVWPQGVSAAGLLGLENAQRVDYSFTLTDGDTRGTWIVSYVDTKDPEWRIEHRETRDGGSCFAQVTAQEQSGRWSKIDQLRLAEFPSLEEPTAYSVRIWPESDPALNGSSSPILSVLYAGADHDGFSTPYRISTNGVTGDLYRIHLPPGSSA